MDNITANHYRMDKDNVLTLIGKHEGKLEEKSGLETITILENKYTTNSGERIRYSLYKGIVFNENEEKSISNCTFSIEDKKTINNEFINAENHLKYICNVNNDNIKNNKIPIVNLCDIVERELQIEILKEKTQDRQTDNSKTYVLDLLYTDQKERNNGFGKLLLDYGVSSIKNIMKNEDTMYLNAAPTIRDKENVEKLVELYKSVGMTSIVNKIDWEVMIAFKEDLKVIKVHKDETKINNQSHLLNLAYG